MFTVLHEVDCYSMESIGDTVAGGLGGLARVLTGQPFDTIKVKLQTYPHVYRTLTHSVTKPIYWEEGVRGFYAGSAPAILTNINENAVLFLCYNQWATGTQRVSDLTTLQRACCRSLAGVFSSIACVPPTAKSTDHCISNILHSPSRLLHGACSI